MAGILIGLECARRREYRRKTGWYDSLFMASHDPTRESSFCLYLSDYESSLASISSLGIHITNEADADERLDQSARVAKMKLDERLRARRKSEDTRHSIRAQRGSFDGEMPKNAGWRRFRWERLRWNKGRDEEEDCAICLEPFTSGQSLVELPCPHRFHSMCLVPWLESNAHCPCCRMQIPSR